MIVVIRRLLRILLLFCRRNLWMGIVEAVKEGQDSFRGILGGLVY